MANPQAKILRLSQKDFNELDPFESLFISNYLIQALNKAMLAIPSILYKPEFTLWLDIAIKLTNAANRIQTTIGLLMPESPTCTTYHDRNTVAKLLYFGNGNFGRLFSFDKTGNIDRTPTLMPLSQTLNKYMAIYLYLTRSNKDRTHVFLIDQNKDISSRQLLEYMFQLLTGSKSQTQRKWRQHDLRALYLNRIGILHEYQENAFEHASEITRHTIAELHNSYVFWCRLYQTKQNFTQPAKHLQQLEFPHTLNELHQIAVQFCEDSYLPQILTLSKKTPVPRSLTSPAVHLPVYFSSEDSTRYRELTCVGIDTSPLCSVVAMRKQDGTYEIHVYCDGKMGQIPSLIVHQNLSLTDRIQDIVHRCKGCVVAVEKPLEKSKKVEQAQTIQVDKAQTIHTQLLIESLAECFTVKPPDTQKLRSVWLQRKGAAQGKNAIKTENYTEYNRKRQQELPELPPLLPPLDPITHPVSDIVDAVIVCYWLQKWHRCAHIPKTWIARLA